MLFGLQDLLTMVLFLLLVLNFVAWSFQAAVLLSGILTAGRKLWKWPLFRYLVYLAILI
jgi:hypothetical protein